MSLQANAKKESVVDILLSPKEVFGNLPFQLIKKKKKKKKGKKTMIYNFYNKYYVNYRENKQGLRP